MRFDTLRAAAIPVDIGAFAQHCEMLAGRHGLPHQQDFSLADVSWLYGRIYELDVLDIGPDYYFRMFGIFWQAIYGEDFTGRWLSEIELRTDKLDRFRKEYDLVVASREPFVSRARLIWPDETEIVIDRLFIPFTLDGETVSQIVAAAHYDSKAEDIVYCHGDGLPRMIVEKGDPIRLARVS